MELQQRSPSNSDHSYEKIDDKKYDVESTQPLVKVIDDVKKKPQLIFGIPASLFAGSLYCCASLSMVSKILHARNFCCLYTEPYPTGIPSCPCRCC